jgi:large subunit ribosomal protein L7A
MIGEAEKEKLHVGYKQALRALNDDKASKVFIAEDSDAHIKDGIGKLAAEKNTPVFFVPTMKELGAMCSIEVGASCATVLK